jgi:autotransporter strand-loop-strand O-heptosyltransferase
MKIINVTPGLLPIPPNGWGAVEKIIWETHLCLKELGYDSQILYLNEIPSDADIVHIHVANLANEAHQKGIPYYFTMHDHHAYLYGKDSHAYRENLEAIRNAKRAFVPAKYLVDWFEGIPEYFSHGVNTDFFRNDKTPTTHRLLCVANNGFIHDQSEDRKGFGYAIEAAKRLGLPITIVGPENNRKYFEKFPSDYQKLKIVYGATEEELLEIYKTHSIFLHPSILEAGHPNLTLLEAMACGLPVLATFEDDNELEGLIRIERNTDSIISAIATVFTDYSMYSKIARNQAEKLSWKNRTIKMISKYHMKNSTKEKVIFWHTYLVGEYKLILQEQISKLILSGLYDEVDCIYTGIISNNNDDTNWFLNLLKSYKKFSPIVHEKNGYEQSTLRCLHEYAEKNDSYILYFHSKSVSNPGYPNTLVRWLLEYHTIYKWKECLSLLDEGYDAIGIDLRMNSPLGDYTHFSGNFWWSKSSYIKTLDKKYIYDTELFGEWNRFSAEFYIGANPNAKLISLFESEHIVPFNGESIISKYLKVNETHKKEHKKLDSMKESLIHHYNNTQIINRESKKYKPNININNVDGPFVEITGEQSNKKYRVEFIDNMSGVVEHSHEMPVNHWTKCSIKYFVDWNIRVYEDGVLIEDYHTDFNGKNVYIALDSKSLGDTFAWFPYMEEFRKQHGCNIICSTFWNDLFKSQYPQFKFINPGETAHNIVAMYSIGLFYATDSKYDGFKHPNNPIKQPLQKIASDILGLEYVEVSPKIKSVSPAKRSKRYVVIGIHSTSQNKYWNNPSGWKEVVEYLNSQDIEPVFISKEGPDYMGNRYPDGVTTIIPNTIEEAMSLINGSEFFIGISSGLSWLAWSLGKKVVMISGFTEIYNEFTTNCVRIINESVCHGCWNRTKYDPGDWNFCPDQKGTPRQFECTKSITGQDVVLELKKLLQ